MKSPSLEFYFQSKQLGGGEGGPEGGPSCCIQKVATHFGKFIRTKF